MAKNVGIYSGSFDPVHEGHIAFAKEAMRACRLDTVVFIPERLPRNKPGVSPVSERHTELELSLASLPFEVVSLPMDKLTVDAVLPELDILYPESKFTILLGSDVVFSLPNWSNIEKLLTDCTFAVGMRKDDDRQSVERLLMTLGATYTIVETEYGHMSSSSIRLKQTK